jgi:uncharacterized membrane protein
MRKLYLTFGSLFFLITLLTSAFTVVTAATETEITYLKIDVEIMEDRSLNESIDILLNPQDETDFNIYLPKNYTNLQIIYNNEKIVSTQNDIIKLLPNELNSIKVSYTIPNAIESKSKEYIYMKELVYKNVKNLIFRIKLPEAYGIDRDDVSTIIPEPTYLQSDGKKIIVLWEMKSPSTPIVFKVKYNSLIKNSGFSSNILLILAALLIVLISLIYIIFNKFSKTNKVEIKIPPSLLSEDEMVICDIIKGEGGKIKQKKLSSITGFSKAKITKILTNLEKKELIEREPMGRTFVIILKKNIDH